MQTKACLPQNILHELPLSCHCLHFVKEEYAEDHLVSQPQIRKLQPTVGLQNSLYAFILIKYREENKHHILYNEKAGNRQKWKMKNDYFTISVNSLVNTPSLKNSYAKYIICYTPEWMVLTCNNIRYSLPRVSKPNFCFA